MNKIDTLLEKFIGAKDTYSGYHEIFINPTKRELKETADSSGNFRFIADSKKKKLYIFPVDLYHSDAWDIISGNASDNRRMYKVDDLFGGVVENGKVENWGFRDNLYKKTILVEWINDPDIFAFTGKWGLNVVEWIESNNKGLEKLSNRVY